ncbi:hypothetical protein [Govanella unica]|uniref:Uncharacterized protein n=1 Tax=Govanella unica TaxID=2975056 RepID=A0A9X3TW37_9PROT|nr:hypothetical protein [Govania unica]MDA5192502.1 hypothetical protein [Govania unica]
MADDTTVTLAQMRSSSVILDFIKDESLLPDLYPRMWDQKTQSWKDKKPSLERAALKFAQRVTAAKDKDGLITVTASWNSAANAQAVVQKFIARINKLRRDQARLEAERNLEYLYARLREEPTLELRNTVSSMIAKEMRTIMRTENPSDYSLKIIDPPLIPEFRSSPKRALLVLLGAIFGFAAGVISLLIRQSLRAAK